MAARNQRTVEWWQSKPKRATRRDDRGCKCSICGALFVKGEFYHDAGNDRRAHIGCVRWGSTR
jgi:hypothetical protein